MSEWPGKEYHYSDKLGLKTLDEVKSYVFRNAGNRREVRADLATSVMRWLKNNIKNYPKDDLKPLWVILFYVLMHNDTPPINHWDVWYPQKVAEFEAR